MNKICKHLQSTFTTIQYAWLWFYFPHLVTDLPYK